MLIFVEGIDKAGKSVFINHLSQVASLPIYRKLPPTLQTSDHHNYFKGVGFALVELHQLFKFDVVVDRSFVSDWVYTNKQAPQKNFAIWHEWELRQQLVNESSIIYVEIPYEVFVERISADPDPYMGANDYNRHTELYEEYLRKTSLPFVRINGNESPDEQLAELRRWSLDMPLCRLRAKLLNYLSL